MSEAGGMNRRQFLRGLARTAGAGGLVAGMGLLVLREEDASCPRPVDCRACSRFKGCELPERQQAAGRSKSWLRFVEPPAAGTGQKAVGGSQLRT